MALVIKKLYEGYLKLEELRDPRSYGDPYTASPLCLLGVIGIYIYIFKSLGPKFMQNREPYNVKTAMIIYNILQIVFNLYLTISATIALYEKRFGMCLEIDYSTQDTFEIQAGKLYMYLKIFDAGDTLFFLLRKSYRQISFLHLYHHTGMMIAVWVAYRYYCGGNIIWLGVINAFVHTVMFFYYLMTTINPSWKQSLAFKRSLTQLQIVQFILLLIIFGKTLIWPTCNFPKFPTFLFVIQDIFMLFLFSDFYFKTYVRKPKIK